LAFEYADRIKRLPPYLFAEIEKTIKEKKAQGVDLISLSIGDPDLPPPPFITEALKEEAANKKNHNYSFSQGEPDFREAVAGWYKKRFGVNIAYDQVVALLGSKGFNQAPGPATPATTCWFLTRPTLFTRMAALFSAMDA
jgi:LL-diaminopimelate aminotransferase